MRASTVAPEENALGSIFSLVYACWAGIWATHRLLIVERYEERNPYMGDLFELLQSLPETDKVQSLGSSMRTHTAELVAK